MTHASDSPEQPVYGTWIRRRNIIRYWIITGTCLFAALVSGAALVYLFSLNPPVPGAGLFGLVLAVLALVAGIMALLFAYIAIVITLVSWRFSPRGGDWQARIHQLILDRMGAPSHGLDIGCGNGHLVIKAAKRFPMARFAAIDYWGEAWEYSAERCRRNAELEGVAPIDFRKASASELPFGDGGFDLVVSCLTFHEVGDVRDRTVCLKEALRVLAPGGRYVFFDLFEEAEFWPDQAAISAAIAAGGGEPEADSRLLDEVILPRPLSGRKALGGARFLVGTKA